MSELAWGWTIEEIFLKIIIFDSNMLYKWLAGSHFRYLDLKCQKNVVVGHVKQEKLKRKDDWVHLLVKIVASSLKKKWF